MGKRGWQRPRLPRKAAPCPINKLPSLLEQFYNLGYNGLGLVVAAEQQRIISTPENREIIKPRSSVGHAPKGDT